MHRNSRRRAEDKELLWNRENLRTGNECPAGRSGFFRTSMKETEVIIIGQGLSGTWLSWWLSRAGISFLVIDKPERGGASLKSAGLINPVTGRRWVKTWRIEELMPFAESAYQQMGETLNEKLISNTSVIDLFPSVQMKQAFQKSREEDPQYLIQS